MTCRNCSGGSRVAGRGRADAGVVDEHVDPSELGHRGVDERLALLGVGDVGGDRDDAAPGVAYELRGLLEPVDPSGAERHVGPGLGQGLGERDAEAAGGAGHDRDLAVEAEQVEHGAARVAHAVDPSLGAWTLRSGR